MRTETTTGTGEDLARRLPFPLAQLYRRAHNAKTALERHQAAYYLWEAGLKLLGSVALVEYVALEDRDPALLDRLKNLARPSLGHWWEFVRKLLPVLAESGKAPAFTAARDLLLGRARDDMPRAAGLEAALREASGEGAGGRSVTRLSELFDALVRYRNRELGHGAPGQRAPAHYEKMGSALLAGSRRFGDLRQARRPSRPEAPPRRRSHPAGVGPLARGAVGLLRVPQKRPEVLACLQQLAPVLVRARQARHLARERSDPWETALEPRQSFASALRKLGRA